MKNNKEINKSDKGFRVLRKESSHRRRVLIGAFVIMSVVFTSVIFYSIISSTRSQLESASQFVNAEEAKIQNAIISRITTTKALEMYVIGQKGDVSGFQDIAADLCDDDPALMSIQLAPNGVVSKEYIYPPNEDFATHDLFADPERREDVEKSRDSDEVVVSGPLELRQGGIGMIARNPIYLIDDDGEKSFWGFAMVVLDMSKVFDTANLEILSSQKYYYRLWRYLPDSEEMQIIASNTDKEIGNAVHEDIEVYNGMWYLDIAPYNKWVSRPMVITEVLLFSIITVLSLFAINSHLKIREVFYYDGLLNIGNFNALSVVFDKLPKEGEEQLYLVVFDIDKFKEFNYIYGEEEGDKLLRYIVNVLLEISPNAHLFRLSADVFTTLDYCANDKEYEERINVVLDRFKWDIRNGAIQPFDISAGVQHIHKDDLLQRVMSDALIARGTIKDNATEHYAFFDESTREKRVLYMSMESGFEKALHNHEFVVYYQPKYEIRTGEMLGAEALVRWIKSDGRIISPAEFIPCFEDSRQIVMLDEEVLRQVCIHINAMQNSGIDVKPISVNLSRVHLREPDIITNIEKIIKQTEADPTKLSFEITESALLEESIPMREIIDSLHSLGCTVAMDDYGIGASNIEALISNNFDILKLDKSFVDRIGDEKAEDIIRSTTHMAIKWGMEVLAEGVEEKYQAERLVELGCSEAQGFFYERPVTADKFREIVSGSANAAEGYTVPMVTTRFSEEICSVLDGNVMPTYIIDPDRFVVMYCNQALRDFMGVDPTGGLCYKKLRGREKPCEDCPATRLYRDGNSEPNDGVHPNGARSIVQPSPLHWLGKTFIQITFIDITRQKQLENELRLKTEEYGALIRKSTTGVLRYDIKTDTVIANIDGNLNRVEEYKIPNYSVMVMGKDESRHSLVTPESMDAVMRVISDVKQNLPSKGYDVGVRLENGDKRSCHVDYLLLKDNDGTPSRVVLSVYDNTDEKKREDEYHHWQSRLQALSYEKAAFLEINLTEDIIESEGNFGPEIKLEENCRFSEFVKSVTANRIAPEDAAAYGNLLNRERLIGQFYDGQTKGVLVYRYMLSDDYVWFRAEVQMVPTPSNDEIKAFVLFTNIDAEVRERERLEREAECDSMTGLYNHAAAERYITEAIERQAIDEYCCLVMIDINDLRSINSKFGHPEGDRAIAAVADTMKEHFGEVNILARIGGDEFIAFLCNVPEGIMLHTSVSGFMAKLREIRVGPKNDTPITVSAGGAVGVGGKSNFNTLYGQADRALYYTKSTGKNDFNMYVPELEDKSFNHNALSTATLSTLAWYDSEGCKRMLKALSFYFPLVIAVNLTKNTFYMMEYMSYATQGSADEGVFDNLIEEGAAAFHPEDRQGFIDKFSRENLLKAYAEGQTMVSHRGRQRGDDGIYRVVHTVVVFVPDEETGDICEITFTNVEGEAEKI